MQIETRLNELRKGGKFQFQYIVDIYYSQPNLRNDCLIIRDVLFLRNTECESSDLWMRIQSFRFRAPVRRSRSCPRSKRHNAIQWRIGTKLESGVSPGQSDPRPRFSQRRYGAQSDGGKGEMNFLAGRRKSKTHFEHIVLYSRSNVVYLGWEGQSGFCRAISCNVAGK